MATTMRDRDVEARQLTRFNSPNRDPPVRQYTTHTPTRPNISTYFHMATRTITPSTRKRLEPQFPPRIPWASGLWQSKMTAWHYTVKKCKTLKRLRNIHAARSPTPEILSPVKTTQVIYVLYDIRSVNRLYVGQTKLTAFERFTQHVQAARREFRSNTESDLFHKHIARVGWQHFRIYPIEHIPGVFPDTRQGATAFRSIATPREIFWKRTLHAFAPKGFCLEGKSHKNRSVETRSMVYSQERRAQNTAEVVPRESRRFISRLFEYKIKALFNRIRDSTFTAKGLLGHARRNLMKMYDLLHDTEHTHWEVSRAHHLILKEAIHLSLSAGTMAERRGPSQIVAVQLFLHREMERLGLGKIVADIDRWQRLVPPAVRDRICRPVLAYKYSEPVYRRFCNYAGVAHMKEEEINKILNEPCHCKNPSFRRFQDKSCGHVITTDTTILRNARLSDLMAKGTMFRSTVHKRGLREGENISETIKTDLHKALRSWKAKIAVWFSPQDACLLHPWVKEVQMTVDQTLFPVGLAAEAPTNVVTDADKKRLGYLHKHFVFTTVDKAGNNFCIMCKKHYVQACLNELREGVAYELSDMPVENCLSEGERACRDFNIEPQPKSRVPNFHIRVKLHKDPIGFRFVAGSPNAPFTPVSKWLTKAFKAIMPETDRLWMDVVKMIPGASERVKGSWIINDSMVVKDMCARYNGSRTTRKPVHLSTYDFTSMYTTLPLEDLKLRIGKLLKDIFRARFDSNRVKFLIVCEDDTFEWITGNRRPKSSREKIFSVDQLMGMLGQLVDNTYVTFGGQLWHQVIGIPMGTNCAGFIANLYCFTYELDFLRRIVHKKLWDVARQLLNCSRYIDDLLVIGIQDFDGMRYLPEGIYPKGVLELNLADSGWDVPYMDIHIRQNKRRGLISAIYDKRLDDKFTGIQVIRYPHIESFLSNTAKYGIVTSQMHRFARRCSLRSDYVYNASLVIHRMILKGYLIRMIWPIVRRFISNHPEIYSGDQVGTWVGRIKRKLRELTTGHVRPGPKGQIVCALENCRP